MFVITVFTLRNKKVRPWPFKGLGCEVDINRFLVTYQKEGVYSRQPHNKICKCLVHPDCSILEHNDGRNVAKQAKDWTGQNATPTNIKL